MRRPKPKTFTPRQEALFGEVERSQLRARAACIGAARLLGDFPSRTEVQIARELLEEAYGHFQNADRCHRLAERPRRKNFYGDGFQTDEPVKVQTVFKGWAKLT